MKTSLQKAIAEVKAYCQELMQQGNVNPHAIAMGTKIVNIMEAHNMHETITDKVKLAFKEVMGLEPNEIHLESTNNDLDVDSLAKVTIVMTLERDFGIAICDSEITNLKCFEDYVRLVENKLPSE
jgi:acyl carrier protein